MARLARNGSRDSPVVIVGESLGPQESRIPFDGGVGWLVDRVLQEADKPRDAVFITNVVDWHPRNGYRLTRQDIDFEIPRLRSELKSVSPKLVICLGRIAATTLRTLYPEARELRWPFTAPRKPIDNGPALLFALHPSAAIRARNKLPESEREGYERRYVSSLARALRWSFLGQ
ncbi:uracil-DNA glycosylase family protein [Mycobacterium sp.]|uniref:uracil-DNA glycosylase family protein n=1 Tax=Mycobacterium sp. TaxID=1785 RepID=UPI00257B5732|nr:uracil-DNA glycosylase family protein [Mycobacterium sp.]